jgi:hypothetical protein
MESELLGEGPVAGFKYITENQFQSLTSLLSTFRTTFS